MDANKIALLRDIMPELAGSFDFLLCHHVRRADDQDSRDEYIRKLELARVVGELLKGF